MSDLTNSEIERKNILNNNIAIPFIYEQVSYVGVLFEGKYRFTKNQVSSYFEVDNRTIDRLLENHKNELEDSGYELFAHSKLKLFKEAYINFFDGNDTNVVSIDQNTENESVSLAKASQLGVFTFKSFLNVGMLLTGSEKAQQLRSMVLDIVIDTLNKQVGGNTKFINQREEDFLPSALREYNYRKVFTDAIHEYIEDNKFKYSQLTDRIYKSIFKENAKEYRQILKLNSNESVRNSMYSEVLDIIAGYENGFAEYLKSKSAELYRKLKLSEAYKLYDDYEKISDAFTLPQREKARSVMASRDMAFRDALHEKLKEYISEVSPEDFDKFLGEKSKTLEERLEEHKEVFKRLKDR